jgi:hypothetical protein
MESGLDEVWRGARARLAGASETSRNAGTLRLVTLRKLIVKHLIMKFSSHFIAMYQRAASAYEA